MITGSLNNNFDTHVAADWTEMLNSDAKEYGGSGVGNLGEVEAGPVSCQGRRYSLCLTLAPLSVLFLANAEARRDSRGSAP